MEITRDIVMAELAKEQERHAKLVIAIHETAGRIDMCNRMMQHLDRVEVQKDAQNTHLPGGVTVVGKEGNPYTFRAPNAVKDGDWWEDAEGKRGVFQVVSVDTGSPIVGAGGGGGVEDDWILWEGGDRPVPEDALVEYRMRDDVPFVCGSIPAGMLRWEHLSGDLQGGDIIAYRVVKE